MKIITGIVFLLLVVVLVPGSYSQDPDRLNPTPDSSAKDQIYIPADLEDSFVELKRMLTPAMLKNMNEGSEESMVGFHFGLGMWMRNNWGLRGGSRLAKYFNKIGIDNADDMSGIILDSFWRHLHSKPIKLKEQVAHYQMFWKVNREPKPKRCRLDGSSIVIGLGFDESTRTQPRMIHIGKCKKDHLWAYEWNKGWYRPNASMTKEINKSRKGSIIE